MYDFLLSYDLACVFPTFGYRVSELSPQGSLHYQRLHIFVLPQVRIIWFISRYDMRLLHPNYAFTSVWYGLYIDYLTLPLVAPSSSFLDGSFHFPLDYGTMIMSLSFRANSFVVRLVASSRGYTGGVSAFRLAVFRG